MITRLLVLMSLTLLSFTAGADFRTVQRAYEVVLSDFHAPTTANGAVSFQACRSCDVLTVRVTPLTRYQVNNDVVELAEFRRQLRTISDRDAETIIVLHHLETNTVTAISVTL